MLKTLIEDLSHDPFNPVLNFDVAVKYEKQNQIASAVSFYLRCAEYGNKETESYVYASLLKLAHCFEEQNDRLTTVSNCLLQAIAFNPYRPEGYFLLARFHERAGNWQECYTYACIGQSAVAVDKLPVDVDYPGDYCLEFEKGVSAYWIGRKQESIDIMRKLSYESITEEYANAVKSNLARIDASL